jgi:uncharacterized protein (TIGR03437 family)
LTGSALVCFGLLATVGVEQCAGQVCRLSVAGLNRNRKVTGEISAECPGNPLHSAPFGNWGATSNYGQARDSHQFDGWCHDTRICDNQGRCQANCSDGWYEWNSCTTDAAFRAPNCTLYNDGDCTSQKTATGVNVHGTVTVNVPVRCPIDTDGDRIADAGGCSDLRTYTHTPNFLSLYELDLFTGNDLVQTLYFPPTPVAMRCNVAGCEPSGSEWVSPNGYDSPVSPAKVYAEMATAIGSGVLDAGGACPLLLSLATVFSAASYQPLVAPGAITSAFGVNLSATTAAAEPGPLPTTLGGIRVAVTDSAGQRSLARLFYVASGQVNFVLPDGASLGEASLSIESATAARAIGSFRIEAVAPALFTADGTGRGRPAAWIVRATPGGGQSLHPAAEPVNLSTDPSEVVLVLFGTGIRGRGDSPVQVTIGEVAAEVLYAGPQSEFAGLDQVNVRIPRTLTQRGEIPVRLAISGRQANPVSLQIR